MSDRHIEILAEVTKISVGEIKQDLSEPDGIKNRYIINTTDALTAMKRVEEELTPKTEQELMAFMLTNIIRMSDEKRAEFIRDLFIRYPELNPKADTEADGIVFCGGCGKIK